MYGIPPLLDVIQHFFIFQTIGSTDLRGAKLQNAVACCRKLHNEKFCFSLNFIGMTKPGRMTGIQHGTENEFTEKSGRETCSK
jgi:hypothetical protein